MPIEPLWLVRDHEEEGVLFFDHFRPHLFQSTFRKQAHVGTMSGTRRQWERFKQMSSQMMMRRKHLKNRKSQNASLRTAHS